MKPLINGSLQKPVAVVVIILALGVFAATALTNIQLKYMPDMEFPVLIVYATYPGAAPEEVDDLVIDKLSGACESIAGIKNIQTRANENFGMVIIQFEYGTDISEARDDVKSQVESVQNDLPDDVKSPTIMEMSVDQMDDMTISVTGAGPDVDVLHEVEEEVEPELRKVASLADISLTGGNEKYIKIELVPEYLNQYGLDISAVANAISAMNFSMPAGSADFGNQNLNISAEVEYKTLPQLEQVPINTSKGQVIHLSDIAKVFYAIEEKTAESRYNGQDNVSIGLKRKKSSSPVTLSRDVKKRMEIIKAQNPSLGFEIVNDSADDIMDRLQGVAKTVLQAVALAMIVLFIFFGDLKASLIVGSSMPVSIMATLILMSLFDFTLNVITLGAIMIAVGMMTDNAVVVIEMCFRKMQEGLSFKEAALEGTAVVANAVTGSTITTVVVYIPLATMEGLSGQMFKQMGFTIIFALMASLISAITIIPLCFAAYKPVEKREILTTRILRKVSRIYARVLRFFLKWKKTVFLLAIVMLIVTFRLAGFLRSELMPSTDSGEISLSIEFRPNLQLAIMDDEVKRLESFIADTGIIDHYTSSVTKSSYSGSINVKLNKDLDLDTQ